MSNGIGRTLLGSVLVVGCLAASVGAASAQNIGPSTTTDPYVLPNPALGGLVTTTSILTVGDTIDGYPMVGIPDGLGAFKIDGGKFTLLMNHEFPGTSGAVHAHGSAGAFVSRWKIKKHTLEVLKGEDQTPSPNDVYSWDKVSGQYVQGTASWDRFCSADLPARSALAHGHKGTKERIYLNGEETRPPFSPIYGSAWAHIATGPNRGQSWELPRLGQMSFEHVVASPYSEEKTVVILLDDSSASTSPADPNNNPPSELYVYVGTKTRHGNEIERAGLTNGTLYGMKVAVNGTPVTEESNADGLGGGGVYVGSG